MASLKRGDPLLAVYLQSRDNDNALRVKQRFAVEYMARATHAAVATVSCAAGGYLGIRRGSCVQFTPRPLTFGAAGGLVVHDALPLVTPCMWNNASRRMSACTFYRPFTSSPKNLEVRARIVKPQGIISGFRCVFCCRSQMCAKLVPIPGAATVDFVTGRQAAFMRSSRTPFSMAARRFLTTGLTIPEVRYGMNFISVKHHVACYDIRIYYRYSALMMLQWCFFGEDHA